MQLRPPNLIIDLSCVHYLGAVFIGIIVSAWDEVEKQNRHLMLCGLNPYCARLLRTLHLDRLIAIHAITQAALEDIGANIRARAGQNSATPVRVQVTDVSWDPNLFRLEYVGADAEPIRCEFAQRR